MSVMNVERNVNSLDSEIRVVLVLSVCVCVCNKTVNEGE